MAHYVDGEAKGRAEGKVEKSKSHVIKFYKTKYPNEDISWLENLTEKQYDEIFDMLLNNEVFRSNNENNRKVRYEKSYFLLL